MERSVGCGRLPRKKRLPEEIIFCLNCSSHNATQSETLKPNPGGIQGKNDHFIWKPQDVTCLQVSHQTHVFYERCASDMVMGKYSRHYAL